MITCGIGATSDRVIIRAEERTMAERTRSSRRVFLKSTLTAGAGMLICDSQLAFGYKVNERLNIAAIGAGGRAVESLRKVGTENIVALCDVDERQAVGVRKKHPGARFFRDFRQMLSEMGKQIDAVVVSTPDHTHAVASIAAMKHGKHVYCEKPLSRTVLEARAMRLAAEKYTVVTQMGNQGSYSDGVRRASEWCWAGTAGPIREAYVWVGDGIQPVTRPTDKPAVPVGLDWDLWQGPALERPYHSTYVPKGWRPWFHYGSGRLGDMGCHTGNILFRGLRLERLWESNLLEGKAADGSRIRIEGESKGGHEEGYPSSIRVTFHLPARGDLPPVKLTVSNGKDMRPSQDLLPDQPFGSYGSLLVGTEASIYSSDPWNRTSSLHPREKGKKLKEPEETLPRRVGHWNEWIAACKGKGEPFSSFAMGGPLTELILLANIAARVEGAFTYDPIRGEISDNSRASDLLHREYRTGWTL